MATLNSYLGFSIEDLDLWSLNEYANDVIFYDNIFLEIEGNTYADLLDIYWFDYSWITYFGGSNIVYDSATGAVRGGTITGIFEDLLFQGLYEPSWDMQGLSVSAKAFYQASLTFSADDDKAIIKNALSGADTLLMSDFDDAVGGFGGADLIYGYDGADRLDGGDGDDTISGGTGSDKLYGEAGNDTLRGDGDSDSLSGGIGKDRLEGGGSGDTLKGDNGDDRLNGNDGNDTLYGGSGADRLDGDAGRDRLYAGKDSSRDVFDFNSAKDSRVSSRDMLYEFDRGEDDIDLRGIDAREGGSNNAFKYAGTKAQAYSVWWDERDGDVVVSADVTGNKTADFQIKIVDVMRLSSDDFLL
jgi:Ca2+-binding RTX toxin-like protein